MFSFPGIELVGVLVGVANGIYAVDKDGVLWLNKSGNGDTWISVAKGLSSAENIRISPNGFQVAFSKHVHMHDVMGKDKYKDVPKTTAQIYTSLNYRHWDTWYDGKISHLFVAPINNIEAAKDIVKDLPFDVPTTSPASLRTLPSSTESTLNSGTSSRTPEEIPDIL